MGYSENTQLTEIMVRERDLLRRGLSYEEISELTGEKKATIAPRNNSIYKIDMRKAFEDRVFREGIPNRLQVSDAFGYWFSGYFDGEGCLVIHLAKGGKGTNRRVGVQIACRFDDAGILENIRDTLGVGGIHVTPEKPGITRRASATWRCEKSQDLAQVILPLLDKYPLQSKKGKEYALWRPMVIDQYIRSMGGPSRRQGNSDLGMLDFLIALESIKEIRHPK